MKGSGNFLKGSDNILEPMNSSITYMIFFKSDNILIYSISFS